MLPSSDDGEERWQEPRGCDISEGQTEHQEQGYLRKLRQQSFSLELVNPGH